MIHSQRHAQLCELLRMVRTESGLRQVDLADKLGQPQSFVSKYEAGGRGLDFVGLERVCAACGISLIDLVSRFDN